MRSKFALAAVALVAAASFAPLTAASASCVGVWQDLTGDCSPCDEIAALVDDLPVNCID